MRYLTRTGPKPGQTTGHSLESPTGRSLRPRLSLFGEQGPRANGARCSAGGRGCIRGLNCV
ncbi:hypothetical protein BD413DRAFT_576938 [Trametes elegans]|nr:hypothetical protein BD413DRAFT_576938 [Trametes elegans]